MKRIALILVVLGVRVRRHPSSTAAHRPPTLLAHSSLFGNRTRKPRCLQARLERRGLRSAAEVESVVRGVCAAQGNLLARSDQIRYRLSTSSWVCSDVLQVVPQGVKCRRDYQQRPGHAKKNQQPPEARPFFAAVQARATFSFPPRCIRLTRETG